MKKYKPRTSRAKMLRISTDRTVTADDTIAYIEQFDRANLLKPVSYRFRGKLYGLRYEEMKDD